MIKRDLENYNYNYIAKSSNDLYNALSYVNIHWNHHVSAQ